MKIHIMTKAEADRKIANADAHIIMNQDTEVKTKTSEDMCGKYKVMFYDCKNKNGEYYKYEIYQDDKLVDEEISFSPKTLCERLNKKMWQCH